jgi:hypothetical protein
VAVLVCGGGVFLLWKNAVVDDSYQGASRERPAANSSREAKGVETSAGGLQSPEFSASKEPAELNTDPVIQLPSADQPFADQYAALLEAHRAGNTVASCRLTVGVTECSQFQRSLVFTRGIERNVRRRIEEGAAEVADEALISAVANSLEFLESRAATCGAGSVGAGPSASEIIEFAAPRLSASQKTVLAMLRADGQLRRLNPPNRSYSQSQQYVYPQYLADRALEFLQTGFRAGHPLALEGLAMVHAPGTGIPFQGMGPSLPNPRLYARYALLLQELYGPEVLGAFAQQLIELSLASLPPNEVQQVHQWVASERMRWQSLGASATDKSALAAWAQRSADGDVDALCRR